MKSPKGLITLLLLAVSAVLLLAGSTLADCVSEGRTGNADGQGTYPNEIDSGDLGALIALLFNPPGSVTIPFETEADIDGDGEFTSNDMGTFIPFFYSSPGAVTLPDCP